MLERTPGQPNAVAALEALAVGDAERHRIAVILEPVYRRSGDLNKLVGALEAQLEAVDDRTDRVRILREMAEIYQRLGRPERAFECRSRAWLTDVESAETLAEMEALGLAGGMHGELVAALEKGAVEAGDSNLQAQLWAMTARLLEDPLGRAADAIEAWRSALRRVPTLAQRTLGRFAVPVSELVGAGPDFPFPHSDPDAFAWRTTTSSNSSRPIPISSAPRSAAASK